MGSKRLCYSLEHKEGNRNRSRRASRAHHEQSVTRKAPLGPSDQLSRYKDGIQTAVTPSFHQEPIFPSFFPSLENHAFLYSFLRHYITDVCNVNYTFFHMSVSIVFWWRRLCDLQESNHAYFTSHRPQYPYKWMAVLPRNIKFPVKA